MKKRVLFLFMFVFLYGMTLVTYGQYSDARKWSRDPRMTMPVFPGQGITILPPNTTPPQKVDHVKHVYYTRDGIATVGANFRVHPSNIHQSEVPIVSSFVNRDLIYGSSNAFLNGSLLFSEGMYLSADGGQTWFGSDTTYSSPYGDHGGDPGPAIGPDGTLYMSYLGLSGGVKVAVSTNFGTSWQASHVLVGGSQDKNLTTVNDVASSPYYGRALVAWSDFSASNPPVMVSWSSDGGSSWSTAVDINSSSGGHYCQGVNPQVGPNGEFYIAFQNPVAGSPYTGDFVGFAKSTDGGVTWNVNNDVYDCNGIRGYLFSSQIRVNDFPWMGVDRSGGPRNGWIYIVTAEKNLAPAGSDPDITMHRSTDGGTTWSAGIRVNQDALNNGKYQYMPALCVGDDGSVNVVYYDTRNCTGDSAEVYVSHSVDGGDTWTDILVSDHKFKPMPIPGLAGGYQGDYIGIATASNGMYFPLWADNSTGIYQAWTAPISFEPPCTTVDPPSNPNPAAGATDVPISLSQLTWDNGAGANTNELYFGSNPGNLQLVQSGTLATSYNIPSGTLQYYTTYYWKVNEIGDTCNTSGPTWSFRTVQDPNLVMASDTVRPQSVTYWTGNTQGTSKTDGEINTIYPNVGWAVYDISSLPANATIDSVSFFGYVNATNWPYWSATPMGNVNPVSDPASSINSQIQANYNQSSAYIYSDESSSYGTGWHTYELMNSAVSDLQSALSQGWFAMGFIDRDFSTSYYVNFDGWSQSNPPYLKVNYHYIVPVELTSFNATVNNGSVLLKWNTATEKNNKGFDIQRKQENSSYENIAFVNGAGTSTESHDYTYSDSKIDNGNYTYRLRQVDYDGTVSYSNEVNVHVNVPLVFGLEQNYPNPFNPTTEINYTVAKDGFVSLTVFNALGQEVVKLVDGNVKAGRHQVTFNASRLSSGVYFYRLEQSSKNSVKKMLLLK